MKIQLTFKSGAQVVIVCDEWTKKGLVAGGISYEWASFKDQTKDKLLTFNADELVCAVRLS